MYSYTVNNPINLSDPTGYVAGIDDAVIAIVALLGITVTAAITLISEITAISSSELNASDFDHYIPIEAGLLMVILTVIFAKPSKQDGKAKASDVPDWAKYEDIDYGLSADQNVTKWLNDKYGNGNWEKGPRTEYSKIFKWLTRSKGLHSYSTGGSYDSWIPGQVIGILPDGTQIIFDPYGYGCA